MSVSTKPDWAPALAAAQAHALSTGALAPLSVEGETIVDGGLPFRVEWISSLAMKDLEGLPRAGDKAKAFNPFLPYERDLWVADISDTHVAILNKFPVWSGHLLLITRAFVDQETPLDIADADALAQALTAMDGFLFYNSGGVAGASQAHRHLQMLPGYRPAIDTLASGDVASGAPALPFAHVLRRLDRTAFENGRANGAELAGLIADACRCAGIVSVDDRMPPYNLLITRDWLIVVPRRRETVGGLSLSALSYAGQIGLRTPDQIGLVREMGPIRMMCEAAGRA